MLSSRSLRSLGRPALRPSRIAAIPDGLRLGRLVAGCSGSQSHPQVPLTVGEPDS